jgi:prevent-host-death family protein
LVNLVKGNVSRFVGLYKAKTRLSSLVDRAAAGEEIVIAKNGIPCARLMPIQQRGEARKPENGMHVEYIATDFDGPDPRIKAMFRASPGEPGGRPLKRPSHEQQSSTTTADAMFPSR